MDHFGTGIGLLAVVGQRHRVELADRIVPLQYAGRIFPGDCRTGFHLRPRHFGIDAAAGRALGDEIVNAALAVFVARVPVLHGRIFDFRIVQHHDFDNCRMQLVFVPLGRGAAFQIGNVAAFVGNDQRALELAGVFGIDAKIGGKFHRTAHAFRNVDERTVGKHRRVETGKKVVGIGHHRTEIFLHQLRMLFDRFGNRAEDNALFRQPGPVGGGHRHAVEHRVDRDHAGQRFLLFQGNAELVVSFQQLFVDFVQAFRRGFALGRRIVIQILIINLVI